MEFWIHNFHFQKTKKFQFLKVGYIAYLKSNFENINIIFIDFMDLAYEEINPDFFSYL